MWRSLSVTAVLPVALAMLAGVAHAQIPGLGGNIAQAAGLGMQQDIQLRDTMNFEDCAQQKIKSCGFRICRGDPTWVAALDYREPVALVEVSCVPGKSRLMESSPLIGKAMGSAFKAGMDAALGTGVGTCLQEGASKAGGGWEERGPWHFEARVFAISPVDRFMAASANGKKLAAARNNLACDAFMMFGGRDFWSVLSGALPQGNSVLPTELPSSLTNVLDTMGQVPSMDASTVDGLISQATGGATEATGGATSEIKDAKETIETVVCSPLTPVMAKLSASWKFTLLPLFVSDIARPCWTAGNPASADTLLAPLKSTADVALGPLMGATCAAAAMTDVGSGIQDSINNATLGMAATCVGNWGHRTPQQGFVSGQIRPVAAALAGYRAYDYAVKKGGSNLKNTKGKVMFNLDYPYINEKGTFPTLAGVFGTGPRHGHKGSGCYAPGTASPNWYSQGESMLPDPGAAANKIMQDFKDGASGSIKGNNGDYVFTYWKNTRCCVPVSCPWRAKRKY